MGKISKTFTLLLVLLFLMSLVQLQTSTVKAESKTIVVPDDYSSIQAAISNANQGDRIFVRQGTYNENQMIISKSVEISGENSSNTRLILKTPMWFGGYQLGGTGLIQEYFYNNSLVINADKVELSGFAISYQETTPNPSSLPYEVLGGGSVTVNGNEAKISGNVFVNTGFIIYGSNSIVSSNTFQQFVACFGSNNKLYHNNFIAGHFSGEQYDEDVSAESGSVNIWDDGYPSGGNYWGYFATTNLNATMLDSSGISNKPYIIDKNNQDRYPLLEPFNSSFLTHYLEEIAPPEILVISPTNQTYNKPIVPLTFSADKTINWASYSLDGEPNVTLTIDSGLASGAIINETLTNLTDGYHNITVYANSTFGYNGVSQTVTFKIVKPEPFPTVAVATISAVVVVVVLVVGLLVYFKKHKLVSIL